MLHHAKPHSVGGGTSSHIHSIHTLGAHVCLFISLCLLSQPLFASVGQASASIITSVTWSFFTSLLTHVLMHIVSLFEMCQGKSWQHLNQPFVAG